jgi:hypothetical protein
MKTNVFLRVILAIGLLAAVAVGVHAQGPDALVVNVPFDFAVGNTTLPAGTYTIDRVQSNNSNNLELRSADGHSSAFTSGIVSLQFNGNPKLVFNRYGDQYFLHEIRTAGGVHELARSRVEKKLAEMLKAESVSASGSK